MTYIQYITQFSRKKNNVYQLHSNNIYQLYNNMNTSIRIHSITKKYIIYKITQKHSKHTTIHTVIQNRTKRI